MLNQMHRIFLNTILENISQRGTGLSLLSLKVHTGKAGGSSRVSESLAGKWVRGVEKLDLDCSGTLKA